MVTAHHNQLIRFSTRSDHDLLSGKTGCTSKPCYHCGKSNHKATACYYEEAVCNNGKKKGHITKICRSKLPTKSAHTSGKQPATPTHFVDHDIDEQVQPSEYNPMFTVTT